MPEPGAWPALPASLAEAGEMYEVRAWLEERIGRLAAERADVAVVAELRELVARMWEAGLAEDAGAYYALNLQFHDRLAQLAGNGRLLVIYRRLVEDLSRYRRHTMAVGEEAFPIATREHSAVVDAIAARRPESAGRLLFRHAMKSRLRLHDALAAPVPSDAGVTR